MAQMTKKYGKVNAKETNQMLKFIDWILDEQTRFEQTRNKKLIYKDAKKPSLLRSG